ncbi:MAG: 30S ribosomal protein S18 [Candidatus Omnitrophica bacterium]|nr:30S ribosomal protein S18 [Candidatus Omnitrophota bacterium]
MKYPSREERSTEKKRPDRKEGGSRGRFIKRGKCRFCLAKVTGIDYLDYQNLRKFTTERGKILPLRITGNCAKHQRMIAGAIKRARFAGLMPYLAD